METQTLRSARYESPAEDVIVSGRINGEAAVLQKARIPLRAADGGAGLERPLFSSGAGESSSGRASVVGGRRGGWLGEVRAVSPDGRGGGVCK